MRIVACDWRLIISYLRKAKPAVIVTFIWIRVSSRVWFSSFEESGAGGDDGRCGSLARGTDWASRIWIVGDGGRGVRGGVVGQVSMLVGSSG